VLQCFSKKKLETKHGPEKVMAENTVYLFIVREKYYSD
jgi:hypothetical protein